jgi:hypothetical protein
MRRKIKNIEKIITENQLLRELFAVNTPKLIYHKMSFTEMTLDPLSTQIEVCGGVFYS